MRKCKNVQRNNRKSVSGGKEGETISIQGQMRIEETFTRDNNKKW